MDKIKPSAINLLVFNPAEEVIHYKKDDVTVTDYNMIGKALCQSITKHGSKHRIINVRFLPFCLLKGHEKNIRSMWQKIYEREEWDPVLFMKFRMNWMYLILFTVTGFLISIFNPKYYALPFKGKKSLYTFWCEIVQTARIFYNNKHPKECCNCKLKLICPGLNRAYIKKINQTSLQSYPGKIIYDPLYFCKEFKENFS